MSTSQLEPASSLQPPACSLQPAACSLQPPGVLHKRTGTRMQHAARRVDHPSEPPTRPLSPLCGHPHTRVQQVLVGAASAGPQEGVEPGVTHRLELGGAVGHAIVGVGRRLEVAQWLAEAQAMRQAARHRGRLDPQGHRPLQPHALDLCAEPFHLAAERGPACPLEVESEGPVEACSQLEQLRGRQQLACRRSRGHGARELARGERNHVGHAEDLGEGIGVRDVLLGLVSEEEVHVEVRHATPVQRDQRRRGRDRALGSLVALTAQPAMREDAQSGERGALDLGERVCGQLRHDPNGEEAEQAEERKLQSSFTYQNSVKLSYSYVALVRHVLLSPRL
eukprot:scaffold55608_cov67-Phaeocystis_antarctica.AAC.3